ncbi:MAG: hypothetical protein QOG13_1604 [Sphingomonadales bacterium]|nr:hypothetical protein [Sphingomonadales bacterium]
MTGFNSRRGDAAAGFFAVEAQVMDEDKRDKREKRKLVVWRGQVRRRRKDGWSRRDEDVFLAHYRLTSNASASARAAGKSPSGAFDLRAIDPDFAARWDAALAEARVRLEGKLVIYCETGGKEIAPDEQGAPAEPGMADFDPHFALKLLQYHEARRAGGRRHDGTHRRRVTIEELTQAILRQLDAFDRKQTRRNGA